MVVASGVRTVDMRRGYSVASFLRSLIPQRFRSYSHLYYQHVRNAGNIHNLPAIFVGRRLLRLCRKKKTKGFCGCQGLLCSQSNHSNIARRRCRSMRSKVAQKVVIM